MPDAILLGSQIISILKQALLVMDAAGKQIQIDQGDSNTVFNNNYAEVAQAVGGNSTDPQAAAKAIVDAVCTSTNPVIKVRYPQD